MARVVPDDVSLASTSTTVPLAARARRWVSLVPCPPSSRAISRRARRRRRRRRRRAARVASHPRRFLRDERRVSTRWSSRPRARSATDRERTKTPRSRATIASASGASRRRRGASTRARGLGLYVRNSCVHLLFLARTRVRIGDATTRVDLFGPTRVFDSSVRRVTATRASVRRGREREARATGKSSREVVARDRGVEERGARDGRVQTTSRTIVVEARASAGGSNRATRETGEARARTARRMKTETVETVASARGRMRVHRGEIPRARRRRRGRGGETRALAAKDGASRRAKKAHDVAVDDATWMNEVN